MRWLRQVIFRVIALLGGVSLVVLWLPAHRAAQVDPTIALRTD